MAREAVLERGQGTAIVMDESVAWSSSECCTVFLPVSRDDKDCAGAIDALAQALQPVGILKDGGVALF